MDEWLSVARASEFVRYAMENDMQITSHRRTARTMLYESFADQRDREQPVMKISNDKFDKVMTYLSQNDLQVHHADAGSTVGIYSFIKIIGEMRRNIRSGGTPILSFGSPINLEGATNLSLPPSGPVHDEPVSPPDRRPVMLLHDKSEPGTATSSAAPSPSKLVTRMGAPVGEGEILPLKGERGGSLGETSLRTKSPGAEYTSGK